MLSMNRSALAVLALPLVAGQFDQFLCDTGPDAFDAYGLDVPQTCINVPSEDGLMKRCFYTYIPESCKDITEAPLVVDSHGQGSCALWSAGYTGWLQKAQEECLVVVWPQGESSMMAGNCFAVPGFLPSEEIPGAEDTDLSTYPCCCQTLKSFDPDDDPIDPLFIKMAIDTTVDSLETKGDLSIDTNRIYLTGHSNGCILSLAVAALYSETVAAVACFGGGLVTAFPEDDYSAVPIWSVHGTEDNDIPYDGVELMTLPVFGALGFFSQDQTMSYIADKNDCSEQQVMDLEDGGAVVGKVVTNTNCTNSATVEFVSLDGVAHEPYKLGLNDETNVDTTALAWNFISSRSNDGTYINTTPATALSAAPTEKLFSIALVLSVFVASFISNW